MSTDQDTGLQIHIAAPEPGAPGDDPRWRRLLQPAAIPWSPSSLKGGSIPAEPDVSNANNVARFLEICAIPPFLVAPVMNGRASLARDDQSFWSDNVFSWTTGSPLHVPRLWIENLQRLRDPTAGLMVAMVSATRADLPDPLTTLSFVVIDIARGRADRIDPDPDPNDALDDLLEPHFTALGVTYYRPSQGGTPYIELAKAIDIPYAMPLEIERNLWTFWLLYGRVFFSDATHDAVFAEAARRLGSGEVVVANLLINFYGSFTVDANVHTFGSESYILGYLSNRDRWRYDPKLVARVAQISTLGSTRAQLAQLFSAALREAIGDTEAYNALYVKYMGIVPLYPPSGQDSGPWVPWEQMDDSLRKRLQGGVLRFGYVPSTPYVYGDQAAPIGFDHDLAAQALERIVSRYGLNKLSAEWIVAGTGQYSEAARLQLLYEGLVAGDFDIAMSGQLVEAQVDAPDAHPEWTSATSQLFTGIYYSGLDAPTMKPVIDTLVGASRSELVAQLVAHFASVELRVISASNPGPSPTGATDFVRDINLAGGRAVWLTNADVEEIKRAFLEQEVHFAVGDSNQNSTLCALLGFPGTNLNIPAIDGQTPLPLAAFTLPSS